ncbi:hypothetical protein LINGRAHAP2_LOCUS15015, partial [Linum grandiflorum]
MEEISWVEDGMNCGLPLSLSWTIYMASEWLQLGH